MNLWTITDGWDPFDGGECFLIWAWGSDEAIQKAAELSEHGQGPEDFKASSPHLWAARGHEPPTWRPEMGPIQEHRYEVMRDCGWMEESDSRCESCERYTMGIVAHCHECECCETCGCDPHCISRDPAPGIVGGEGFGG